LIGFIIAWLFMPSSPGPPTSRQRLIGGGPTQSESDLPMKKNDVSIIPIIIAILVLVGIITFGYLNEKRKRKANLSV
jgi:hypothetical protein